MSRTHPSRRALAVSGDGLAWVSWLRVLAIAGVVLIHVTGPTASALGTSGSTLGVVATVLDFFSRWTVPVFVMLSGALLLDPDRYQGPRSFLRRRAWRLVPAVVVWHLVYLVYVIARPDRASDPATLVAHVLNGRLYTALYFFWIVLGLAVITPVLMPFLAQVGQRARLWVGLIALGCSVLTVVTVPLRDATIVWVDTPWTWWLPYLGYYVLGFALRDVVLRGWSLAAASAGIVIGSMLLAWHWQDVDGWTGVLERYAPAEEYYGPIVAAVAVAVFCVGRSVVRPGGLADALTHPTPALVGRRLAERTLGVFAVHLLVLQAVLVLPGIGGDDVATSSFQLIVRAALVLVISYLVALVAVRIPGIRRIF